MRKGPTDWEAALRHKYRLINGDIAINVTAISGLMDDGKSSAFAGAAMKLRDQGLNYREVWAAKADRGTRVHSHLESWMKGQEIDQQEDEQGFLDALENFIADHSPTLIAQEEIVVSDHGYGGRFDLIAEIDDGEVVLIDLKTGGEYPTEHTLQLSAYRYADGIAIYDDGGNLVALKPVPVVDSCACLYVREDGSYVFQRYPADEVAFQQFCNLLDAFKWTRTDQMKALAKEARSR